MILAGSFFIGKILAVKWKMRSEVFYSSVVCKYTIGTFVCMINVRKYTIRTTFRTINVSKYTISSPFRTISVRKYTIRTTFHTINDYSFQLLIFCEEFL